MIFLTILLVILLDLKYRQYQSQAAITKQVSDLTQETDALGKQNNQLADLLSKINTSDFREQVARQQLNYKKQGETVYGFSADQGGLSPGEAKPDRSNLRKWWDYFFTD